MAALVADRSLQRGSSSFMKHAVDRPTKCLSKEHSGLMSWPEHFSKPNQQKQNSAGPSGQVNALSSRALKLSLFGSIVGTEARHRSFPSNIKVDQPHSVSYPRMPMNKFPPLVSVKSEGAASYQKNQANRMFITPQNQTGALLKASNMPVQSSHVVDDGSSDESGAEDEVIVRIDSPSTLSFPQSHPS
ncbi:unnamed protein product [Rhodiola kirilowii]